MLFFRLARWTSVPSSVLHLLCMLNKSDLHKCKNNQRLFLLRCEKVMYAWIGFPWSAVRHHSSTLKNYWWLCLLIGMWYTGIVVLSSVVPTSFVGVDSFDKTRFSFLQDILIIAGNRMRGWRGDVLPILWFFSNKLGWWSCHLWYQHPLWALTLWTKRDSGFFSWGLHNCCGKQNHGGEVMSCHLIDCSALNWDSGLVICGTNILHGCWLFWQNEIQVFCLRAS